MMLCDRLYKLREAETLDKEVVPNEFTKIFGNKNNSRLSVSNPFGDKKVNPFLTRGYNPFRN